MVHLLPKKKQDFLKDVLQTHRILINEDGTSQARKIIGFGAKKATNELLDGLFV